MIKKELSKKRKEAWRISRSRYWHGWEHPMGYCGNQLCCWGKPKDRETYRIGELKRYGG